MYIFRRALFFLITRLTFTSSPVLIYDLFLYVFTGPSSFTLMGINITILVVASLVVSSILGVCVIVLTVYCICYRTSNDAIPISRHNAALHDTSNNFQSKFNCYLDVYQFSGFSLTQRYDEIWYRIMICDHVSQSYLMFEKQIWKSESIYLNNDETFRLISIVAFRLFVVWFFSKA